MISQELKEEKRIKVAMDNDATFKYLVAARNMTKTKQPLHQVWTVVARSVDYS
jgi:hypothetical protein